MNEIVNLYFILTIESILGWCKVQEEQVRQKH